jgi:hypothetical protein
MPKKSHTEEQIVVVLRPVEAGARVAEICLKSSTYAVVPDRQTNRTWLHS